MPESELMAVESGVNLEDGSPFVAIHLDDQIATMSASNARDFALLLLEAAETSLTSCAVREMLKAHNEEHFSEDKGNAILDEIQERKKRLAKEEK